MYTLPYKFTMPTRHRHRRRRPVAPPTALSPSSSFSSDEGKELGITPVYGSDISVPVVRGVTDYDGASTDTVYWGWVILCATWLVVVSGVGSVTGAWDWAWGVEDTVSVDKWKAEDGNWKLMNFYRCDGRRVLRPRRRGFR